MVCEVECIKFVINFISCDGISRLCSILCNSKFSWSNIFMIFVNYSEITKIFATKISLQLLKGLDTLKSQNND